MIRVCLTVSAFVFAVSAAVFAQDGADAYREREEAIGEKSLSAIGAEVEKLGDWDKEYEWVRGAIDRMWESNGWSDEADLFARDTVRAVAAIPPWEFARRIETLSAAVQQRYGLSDAQVAKVNAGMFRTAGALAFRHAGTILKQTREAVQARIRGEPFTPEQIARWSQEGESMMDDMRVRIERLSEEIAADFTPAQREIYERDMASYHKRKKVVDELSERWKRGEWHPADWGLDNDPAYVDQVRRAAAGDAAKEGDRRRVSLQPIRVSVTWDETAWARYVRLFIVRYDLDEAQAQTVWSILRELEQRAADYHRLHADDLKSAPVADRETSPTYAPLRRMFAELQRRLRRVPTDAQLRRASTNQTVEINKATKIDENDQASGPAEKGASRD